MIAGEGWRFPPAIDDIEERDVEAWGDAVQAIDDAVARSRLADLLWERRAQPRPDLHARTACDALVELVERDDWHVMERARCLTRALELARAVRDGDRQDRVVEVMLAFVNADLVSEQGGPGASLTPIRSLLDLPADERPEDLDRLLVRVGDKYGADPWIADSVAEMRVRLMDAEARQDLRRDQVARWREQAGIGDTMLRVHHLERALELARDHHLDDEVEELRRELSEIRPDDLDLKTISAEVEMPREEVDRFIAQFSDAPSWQEALLRLAAQPAPGGSPDELEAEVDRQMVDAPIQFLFTQVVIGPESAGAIFRAATPEAHRRLAVSKERTQAARWWGVFAADALDAIGESFDRPTRAALTDFFANDLIDRDVAERIARALELYWDGEPDESAHVVVPRLERVIRSMARRVGIPVFREPIGDKTGRMEPLGTLLEILQGAFADPGWHAYLVVLLTDPLGLNLRNSISHGLATNVGRHDAALLLQAACLMSTLGLQEREDPPQPPPGAGSDRSSDPPPAF